MNRKLFTILIFGLMGISVNAQTKEYFEIALKDPSNQEPISFATIRLKNSNQGIIADAEGEFRLPFAFRDIGAKLLITSIGYESLEVSVSNLLINELNIIFLNPYVEELNLVVIKNDKSKSARLEKSLALVKAARSLTADEIVHLAIQNIPHNLSAAPFSVLGYYRDYQIVNNEYYNLNEGIIETFDSGIYAHGRAYENFKAAAYSFQRNDTFNQDSTLLIPYDSDVKFIQNASIKSSGGNELTILNVHNPIRNYSVPTFSFVYTLKSHFMNNHKLKRGDITYFEGEPLVLINFRTNANIFQVNQGSKNISNSNISQESHIAIGELLISLEDYAIHRFNYTVFDQDRSNALFNVQIEYRKHNNKMYLNYLTFNNRFVMNDKNILKEKDISFDFNKNEFHITFNKPIDLKAVKNSNFNIKYKNQKLYIEEIVKKSDTKLELKMRPFLRNYSDLEKLNPKDLKFSMRKIKDVAGREIYRPQLLVAYQFREFFIQEVFPTKNISDNILIINNEAPLYFSKINFNQDYNKYWLNSPLKNIKSN